MIGRKNLSKGVKVEVGEEQAAVDLYVVMHYGVPIQEVAWKIRENVKRAVEWNDLAWKWWIKCTYRYPISPRRKKRRRA